jgi:hypothetical protein
MNRNGAAAAPGPIWPRPRGLSGRPLLGCACGATGGEACCPRAFKAETTGVVIETCVKYPGGPTRIQGTGMSGRDALLLWKPCMRGLRNNRNKRPMWPTTNASEFSHGFVLLQLDFPQTRFTPRQRKGLQRPYCRPLSFIIIPRFHPALPYNIWYLYNTRSLQPVLPGF